MKSTVIHTMDLGEAVYFVSVTSTVDPPVFSISLGYQASDGDKWELSRDQLLDLKGMIDSHLKESNIPAEAKYTNQFYNEDSFQHTEEDYKAVHEFLTGPIKPWYGDNCNDVPMA